MSKKVYNLPRKEIENNTFPYDPESYAWISIQEPGNIDSSNEFLDKLNNIKLSFWDIEYPGWFLDNVRFEHVYVYPVDDADVSKIYNFLIDNKNKNIIANCRMGISRSGAISKFCVNFLGHTWDEESVKRASPNDYLYKKLVEEHKRKNPGDSLIGEDGVPKIKEQRKRRCKTSPFSLFFIY